MQYWKTSVCVSVSVCGCRYIPHILPQSALQCSQTLVDNRWHSCCTGLERVSRLCGRKKCGLAWNTVQSSILNMVQFRHSKPYTTLQDSPCLVVELSLQNKCFEDYAMFMATMFRNPNGHIQWLLFSQLCIIQKLEPATAPLKRLRLRCVHCTIHINQRWLFVKKNIKGSEIGSQTINYSKDTGSKVTATFYYFYWLCLSYLPL